MKLTKIFVDALLRDGKAGLGVCMFFPNGSCRYRWAKYCLADSPEEAELLAVDFGLSMALESGIMELN